MVTVLIGNKSDLKDSFFDNVICNKQAQTLCEKLNIDYHIYTSAITGENVVDAFETILIHGQIGEIYNIGSDEEYNVLEVVNNLVKEIKPNTTPKSEDRQRVPSLKI